MDRVSGRQGIEAQTEGDVKSYWDIASIYHQFGTQVTLISFCPYYKMHMTMIPGKKEPRAMSASRARGGG